LTVYLAADDLDDWRRFFESRSRHAKRHVNRIHMMKEIFLSPFFYRPDQLSVIQSFQIRQFITRDQ
jgi:hypothetical protein